MKNPRLLSLLPAALGLAACSTVEGVLGERDPSADPSGTESRASVGDPNRPTVIEEAPPELDEDDLSEWRKARGTILRTFAFRALERGLIEEARDYLEEACETDPSDTASHAALSRIFLLQGDRRAALAYASQAHQYAPEDEEINLVYAAALAENERGDEATRTIEKVWRVNSGNPQFARALLTHYAANGSNDLARRFVETVLEESDDQAAGWALAGDQFLSEGKLDAAVESYRKALELDPKTPMPSSLGEELGIADSFTDPVLAEAAQAEAMHRWEQAERLYRFLLNSQDANPKVNAGLARAIYQQGRLQDARFQLAKIPSGSRTWRDNLLQAKIDIGLGNYASARGALLVARSLRPGVDATELLLQHVDGRLRREAELQAQQQAAEAPDTAQEEESVDAHPSSDPGTETEDDSD